MTFFWFQVLSEIDFSEQCNAIVSTFADIPTNLPLSRNKLTIQCVADLLHLLPHQ